MSASPAATHLPHRRGTHTARVLRNDLLCTEHYRLTLALPAFGPSTPGQFVQLACVQQDAGLQSHEPLSFEWTPGTRPTVPFDPDFANARAYLRRPFSLAARRDTPAGIEIDIIQRVVGKATRWLADLKPGATVSVLGPLGGQGFWIPADLELALLVGGGVGIPPMLYLAEALRLASRQAIAFVGAQRRDLIPLALQTPAPSPTGEPVLSVRDFAVHGYPTVLTTDDGSLGMKGFITQALHQFLAKRPKPSLARTAVYCCGPTPMMKATARVAAEFGVLCQVSLEQPMACGMGTCQSCVVKWKGPGAQGQGPENANNWSYKLTCTDGPVFDARELLW